MGYMRHHAIVVTGPGSTDYAKSDMATVRKHIWSLVNQFEATIAVTELTPNSINAYTSFLVAPDGSKEGWEESEAGDRARDAIITYLNSLRYPDGSTSIDFVEVQFGDDEKETKVIRHSNEEVKKPEVNTW
jgi:hypothetical protein